MTERRLFPEEAGGHIGPALLEEEVSYEEKQDQPPQLEPRNDSAPQCSGAPWVGQRRGRREYIVQHSVQHSVRHSWVHNVQHRWVGMSRCYRLLRQLRPNRLQRLRSLAARLISANGVGDATTTSLSVRRLDVLGSWNKSPALAEAKAGVATSDKLQMSPSSAVRTVHRLLSPGPMPTQMNKESEGGESTVRTAPLATSTSRMLPTSLKRSRRPRRRKTGSYPS